MENSQITNPQQFHPQCRPEEVFDPKSGSCVPSTNLKNSSPVGTLECPEGFVLDDKLGLCLPETPLSQAKQYIKVTKRLKNKKRMP